MKLRILVIVVFFSLLTLGWTGWNSIANYARNLLSNATIGDGNGVTTVKDDFKVIRNYGELHALGHQLYLYRYNSSTAYFIYNGSTLDFAYGTPSSFSRYFTFTWNGNFGVGTTSPDEKLEVEWVSGGTDIELGRGSTDPDVTFITLRSPNGTKYYIYPDDLGNLVVTTTKP